MARYDDLDTKTIAIATIVSSIVLVVLILGGRALSYTWQSYAEEHQINKAKYTTADDTIAAQKAVLQTSGKIQDPPLQEGTEPVSRIAVPVSTAQELISKELGTQPKT
jgi:beta-lactamase regulating signal transducer with metallopeptidase domain